MKLAEALLLRADMQKKFASLRDRIGRNAKLQEGDTASEDPQKLLAEAVGVLDELEKLIVRINRANLASKLPDGRSLTEAIARRDTLVQHHALLQSAVTATQADENRYSPREIKWIATLSVSKLQAQSEDLSKSIRELNARIQETNWNVEVE
jgi:hypothetical protein